MKYTLGLDIGTNSLGWFLITENNQIIGRGVVIFPIGTNVSKEKVETSKNATRRNQRMIKRMLCRYKMRRSQLLKFLEVLSLLPQRDENGNLNSTHRIRESHQGAEFYKTRAMALDHGIEREDLGRIFLILNKYRGFKSSSKTVLDDEDATKANSEEGKVTEGINELRDFMQRNEARTLGEYFHKMYLKAEALYKEDKWHNPEEPYDERAEDENGIHHIEQNYGIRRENGRYTARQMYELEFDLIWAQQKKKYPELTGSKEEWDALNKSIYDLPRKQRQEQINQFKQTWWWKIKHETIFYQRKLKSPKRYISKCSLEKNKHCAPVASFAFQEFRIWKQIADLLYTNEAEGTYNEPLPEEWRSKIFQYLLFHATLKFRTTKDGEIDLYKLLNINHRQYKFNFEKDTENKYLIGNTTNVTLLQALGDMLFSKLSSTVEQSLRGDEVILTTKTEKLWHLLYMKQDNEWLLNVLNDKENWPDISPTIAQRLCELSFEDGYASYSSKALNRLLPFMRNGATEYSAKEKAGYIQESKYHERILASKIKQIRNQEYRNPVVEKSVAEAIKLVNAIIQEFKIDTNNYVINIESTRELRNPKTKREKQNRTNSDIEKRRIEYADFLNEKRTNGQLNFKREIQKSDSIIFKFELWLELSYDKDDHSFQEFAKALKPSDREKHTLWLECGRICPYTGKVISLAKLFSSDIEIEHIIPLSRMFDDSSANKTLTFSNINSEKGNRTAFDFMKSKGEHEFKEFKKRIASANFPEHKQKQFLKENVPMEFSHNAITNTSYIAVAVREKMLEVSREVYFTNGAATGMLRKYDWKLGTLIDKIRYEEETGIDIDEVMREFRFKRKFFNEDRKEQGKEPIINAWEWAQLSDSELQDYHNRTGNDIAYYLTEIDQFDAFKNQTGKKDRTDHRNHALDAFIVACTSPAITKLLSTYNAQREEQKRVPTDEHGNLDRELVNLPIPYRKLKEALRDIIVVNKAPEKFRVKKKNKTKTRKGGKHSNASDSYSIRASLHKDTFYGKIENAEQLGFKRKDVFVSRQGNEIVNFDSENKIINVYDLELRKILGNRLTKLKKDGKKMNKETLREKPLYKYSPSNYSNSEPDNPLSKKGKTLPVIKKIRFPYKDFRSMISLPAKIIDENGGLKIINNNRYASSDGNYLMALYELTEKDKKGKTKVTRDFEIYSNMDVVKHLFSLDKRNQKLAADEIEKEGKYLPLMKDCPVLKSGDLLILSESDADKETIDWSNDTDLKKRLYIVTGMSSMIIEGKYEYGMISLALHNYSRAGAEYKKGIFKKDIIQPFIENSHKQIYPIKVRISNIGKIERLYK